MKAQSARSQIAVRKSEIERALPGEKALEKAYRDLSNATFYQYLFREEAQIIQAEIKAEKEALKAAKDVAQKEAYADQLCQELLASIRLPSDRPSEEITKESPSAETKEEGLSTLSSEELDKAEDEKLKAESEPSAQKKVAVDRPSSSAEVQVPSYYEG